MGDDLNSSGQLYSFGKFTDNSSPPPWPPVSEQMAEANPRQERKRHGVSWKGRMNEDIPKRSAVPCPATHPHTESSPFPSRGLWGISFCQCWESNPGSCTTCQASALPLSYRPSPFFFPFEVISPSVVQAGMIGVCTSVRASLSCLSSALPRPIST